VMFEPVEDDQVLQPAGDEQLAALQETEIAGAQVRPAAVREARPERGAGLVRAVPVASRDARPRGPDLADPAGSAPLSGLGIDDGDLSVSESSAAAGQPPPLFLRGRTDEAAGEILAA